MSMRSGSPQGSLGDFMAGFDDLGAADDEGRPAKRFAAARASGEDAAGIEDVLFDSLLYDE
jgi:hypothetical protein